MVSPGRWERSSPARTSRRMRSDEPERREEHQVTALVESALSRRRRDPRPYPPDSLHAVDKRPSTRIHKPPVPRRDSRVPQRVTPTPLIGGAGRRLRRNRRVRRESEFTSANPDRQSGTHAELEQLPLVVRVGPPLRAPPAKVPWRARARGAPPLSRPPRGGTHRPELVPRPALARDGRIPVHARGRASERRAISHGQSRVSAVNKPVILQQSTPSSEQNRASALQPHRVVSRELSGQDRHGSDPAQKLFSVIMMCRDVRRGNQGYSPRASRAILPTLR